MSRFQPFPSGAARQIKADDLDAVFDTVDAVKGIVSARMGNTGSGSWARTIPGFSLQDATVTTASVSPDGFAAFEGYTRTSDSGSSNAGGEAAFAFSGLVINDNTIAVQSGYVNYLEGRRNAGTGTIHGQEISIVNFGETVQINPYYIGATGSTLNYWASAGRSDLGTQTDLTCIFGAVSVSGNRWTKGFVFGADTIIPGPIGAEFMTVAPGYAIAWSNPADNAAKAFIRSDAQTASSAGQVGLIFTDTGLTLQTPDGLQALVAGNGKIILTSIDVSGNVHALGALVVDGGVTLSNGLTVTIPAATSDADAAGKSVPVNGLYRNGSVVQIRTA